MKIFALITTIFIAVTALAAPSTTSPAAGDIEVRQNNGIPNGPCERCDKYYKDCLHQCWWIDPGCITGCECQTCQAFNGYCRDSCGWKRC